MVLCDKETAELTENVVNSAFMFTMSTSAFLLCIMKHMYTLINMKPPPVLYGYFEE